MSGWFSECVEVKRPGVYFLKHLLHGLTLTFLKICPFRLTVWSFSCPQKGNTCPNFWLIKQDSDHFLKTTSDWSIKIYYIWIGKIHYVFNEQNL